MICLFFAGFDADPACLFFLIAHLWQEERMAEIRKQAEEVRAARLAKQAEVASWVIAEPPEDYSEKKSANKKRKKAKVDVGGDGSEAEANSSGPDEEDEKPKKKKSKKPRKPKYVDPDEDGDVPMGSDGEEGEKTSKPKKKVRLRAFLLRDPQRRESDTCFPFVSPISLLLARAKRLSSTKTTRTWSRRRPSEVERSCEFSAILCVFDPSEVSF